MQRRNFMIKSTAALAMGGLALAGCTTTSNQGAQQTAGDADARRSIDADIDAVLGVLQQAEAVGYSVNVSYVS